MDANNKTSIRIGDFTLETEGSEEAVDRRIEQFKKIVELTTKAGSQHERADRRQATGNHNPEHGEREKKPQGNPASPFRKLFRAEDRIVKLEMMPNGQSRDADAFLLTLLGHKIVFGADLVPVGDLLKGLRGSGITIQRIDQITDKLNQELWNKVGERRAGRFRLTVPGERKAYEIAEQLFLLAKGTASRKGGRFHVRP